MQTMVESILIISSSFVIGGVILAPINIMISKVMADWMYPDFAHQVFEDDEEEIVE
jgi:hypothetical protein